MAGYCLKAEIDLESLALEGGEDLMGFGDSLYGFEHVVVYGSCSFSGCNCDGVGFLQNCDRRLRLPRLILRAEVLRLTEFRIIAGSCPQQPHQIEEGVRS